MRSLTQLSKSLETHDERDIGRQFLLFLSFWNHLDHRLAPYSWEVARDEKNVECKK